MKLKHSWLQSIVLPCLKLKVHNHFEGDLVHVQGPLSALSKVLTDRNMHIKKKLKLFLKSQDVGIFGTTTSFYEMLTEGPSIGPDVTDPQFQK